MIQREKTLEHVPEIQYKIALNMKFIGRQVPNILVQNWS